jgi:hypothetical protein
LPSGPRPTLTKKQVFRLWRCAIKDDDKLVDEIIEQLYENIIAFDYKRAECMIELIVDRGVAARWAFRSLLKDMCTVSASAVPDTRHGCDFSYLNLMRMKMTEISGGPPGQVLRPEP